MTNNKNIIPDYDLLAKYFAGEASVDQIQQIEIWVAEDDANKKSYDRMHFLWMQSAKTELEKKVNVGDAWTKMQFRMSAAKQPKASPVEKKESSIYKKTTRRLLQFAAIIILALGINFIIKITNNTPDYISTESQLSTVDLVLPDNSEIKLNKESKISYPEEFTENKRHVKLKGEAFFDIEPDKEKPFIIDAQFAQIKVVGTSFNVQAYDNRDVVEVTVISGIVELSGIEEGSEKITLKKGEKGIIERNVEKPHLEVNEVEDELHWMTKKLIFKETELYIVAETLARAYNVEIEFANEKLKHCLWNFTFEDASIDEIIEIFKATYPKLNITRTENKIIIDGTACE